jgi:monothiol glutaredoxin
MPQCGFSMAVANVLKMLNIKFNGVNVLEDEEIRNEIKVFSDWPTIPQVYIKGEFIGGCDIVKEMFEKKELQSLLDEKKISYKK